MSKIIFVLSFFVSLNVMAMDGSVMSQSQGDNYAGELKLDPKGERNPGYYTFFDWARGQNGWGYCYEFNNHGYVLNGGRPVHPYNCEQVSPSYFDWARAQNGYFYCFQWTPYHVPMNEGRPVHPNFCR